MKKLRMFFAATITCAVIATASVSAFAATYPSQAEIVADLTGRTVDDVILERWETGKTYGQIAYEANKGSEFIEASTKSKIDSINERVASGKLTQEQGDAAIATLKANQANCTGLGIGSGAGTKGGTNSRGTGTGICDGSGIGANAGGGRGGSARSGGGAGKGRNR